MKIPIGAIIVSIFAVTWTAAGARNLGRTRFRLLFLASVLISGALIYAGTHIVPAHPPMFNGKAYAIAVTLEALLIFLAVMILRMTDHKSLLLPVISIIVGLHFFGMVPALSSNLYWWIGGAMFLLPIFTMSILPRKSWDPVVGLGCALILWCAVICAFF
ncbi:MAG TPA: hypothetical protein VLK27_09910 [Chthoniobacterales bacterium]|nr:hypothetical protein [Chthoniobacterales bacterium]